MTTDELRAKFEEWCADHARNLSLRKNSVRVYWYADTLQAWELWLAAHASRDAEVEALKKDAERYRWLREYGVPELCITIQGRPNYLGETFEHSGASKADAAIDAAMRKGESDE